MLLRNSQVHRVIFGCIFRWKLRVKMVQIRNDSTRTSIVPKFLPSMTLEEARSWLSSFDTVLNDCDGVLWSGNEGIDGSAETVQHFSRLGKRVMYVTNNCTTSRGGYVPKCARLGMPMQDGEKSMFCPSYTAAFLLKEMGFNKKVYVIGESGIGEELDNFSIPHIGIGPDPMPDGQHFVPYLETQRLDKDIGAVIVGFDYHFSFPKMIKAVSYLTNNPKCIFMAANFDEKFPFKGSRLVPGTGTLVTAVTKSIERKPILLGKPSTIMFEAVRREYPTVTPQRTLMIGDRAQSDILFGKYCGLQTLLVMSGCAEVSDMEGWIASSNPEDQMLVPDYYAGSLKELLPLLSQL